MFTFYTKNSTPNDIGSIENILRELEDSLIANISYANSIGSQLRTPAVSTFSAAAGWIAGSYLAPSVTSTALLPWLPTVVAPLAVALPLLPGKKGVRCSGYH